jgi:hypothetical protein
LNQSFGPSSFVAPYDSHAEIVNRKSQIENQLAGFTIDEVLDW